MNCLDLKTLLAPLKVNVPSVDIQGITLDSRYVSSNDLFIAVNGYQDDGRFYIYDAINQGVSAVISEADEENYNGYIDYVMGIPVVYLYNLKIYLSLLAGRFYGHPSLLLNLIGVTGTNGKTTVSHLLFQWVHLLSERTAVMGTVGNGLFNNLFPSVNTTSSAVDIQKMLASFYKKGVSFVSMEVSSHALAQNRVRDLYFQAAVFTNLTHDHLDYHKNISSYEASKWKLFSEIKVKEYIINGDDFFGLKWLLKLSHGTVVTWRRSLPQNWCGKWLSVVSVRRCVFGFKVFFDSSWGQGLIDTKLIGEYNVNNLLLALATLLVLGYPLSILLEKAPQLFSVPGRMEIISCPGYPTMVVDYAHTPDALKRVLLEIRSYCSFNIWCVFGCGGDRDHRKRFMMGKVASKYSDRIIITDDNPRTEESQDIINDIKSGITNINLKYLQVIPNRKEALCSVVFQAKSEDWVLVAGKGHEEYQIVGSNKLVFSDQTIIRNLLGIDR